MSRECCSSHTYHTCIFYCRNDFLRSKVIVISYWLYILMPYFLPVIFYYNCGSFISTWMEICFNTFNCS